MKKIRIIYFCYLIILTLVGYVSSFAPKSEPACITVYYVDRQMMRLIPVSYNIASGKPQKQCKRILDEITYDRGFGSNIRCLVPEGAVHVKVNDGVAIVNIKTKYFEKTEKNRNFENLIIYQLVNSLTSVEGVSRVKFLIDGREEKNFMGFTDMREAFIPDYYV